MYVYGHMTLTPLDVWYATVKIWLGAKNWHEIECFVMTLMKSNAIIEPIKW